MSVERKTQFQQWADKMIAREEKLQAENKVSSAPISNLPATTSEAEDIEPNDVSSEDLKKEMARYTGGLAEFPAFRFGKKRLSTYTEPFSYSDSIIDPKGKPLQRVWTVYPGRHGYGGAFAQGLLFDLHQLWREQGFKGNRIYFGTLRKLHMRSHSTPPSRKDYERLRRNLRILCDYSFDCKNSFWDPVNKCYGSIYSWHLFTSWFEESSSSSINQESFPFGYIEVSETFAKIAREQGFFVTGFDGPFFHRLNPTEQRLALYLSKMFASQTLHKRAFSTLCRALPIESNEPKRARQVLKKAAQGLIDKGYPYLAGYSVTKSDSGQSKEWIAEFRAVRKVPQDYPLRTFDPRSLPARTQALVLDIIEAFDDKGSEKYWSDVISNLGTDCVYMHFSDVKASLNENREDIRRPAALLNKRLQNVARERGVTFSSYTRSK